MSQNARRASTMLLTVMMIGSMLLASLMPLTTKGANQPQAAISSLSSLYDGDEDRASDQLQTLYEAGLVGKDGKMVALDVRQNGKQVDLQSLAMHIAQGGDYGLLTVNGKSVSAEQVIKLEMMREELELASLLNENVEITDAHVSSLRSLLNSLEEGNIDLSEATVENIRSLQNVSVMQNAAQAGLPATASNTEGELTMSDGRYIAPYIDGGTYTPDYGFSLLNPGNTVFYTDDRYDGETASASSVKPEVTVSLGDSFSGTITFTLSAATDVPVSLDYRIGGTVTNNPNGTVTWNAGESGDKEVKVSVGTPNFSGQAFAVLNCSNIKNATFADGKTSYSQSFAISKNDAARDRYSDHQYDATVYTLGDKSLSTRWRTRASYGTDYAQKWGPGAYDVLINPTEYIYEGVVDWFREKDRLFGITIDFGEDGETPSYVKMVIVEFYDAGVSAANRDKAAYFTRYNYSYITDRNWSANKGQFYYAYNRTYSDPISPSHFSEDGKVGFRVKIITNDQSKTPSLNKVMLRVFEVPQSVKASVSVQPGIYTVGEVVPVNVNFDYPVVADADTKVKINGAWYSLPCVGDGTLDCKTLSVGYTVKPNDPSTISVSEVTGLKNLDGNPIAVTEYNDTTVGPETGVLISSGYKSNTIDFANAKWGVDDAFPRQTVTAIIPIKDGSNTQWITNEALDCTENGQGIQMVLPTYGAVELKYYLRSAYFSYDQGLTRYPVYVVTRGSAETPVALVTRYVAPQNLASYVRRDTVTFYMPDYTVAADACYLPDWQDSLTDGGYHYFLCGTDKTGNGSSFNFTPNAEYESAPEVGNATYNYYIKDVVCFDPEAYVTRSQHYEEADTGYIRLDNGKYVVLRDPEHPERQYDVEVVLSEETYQAFTQKYLRMEGSEYILSYQFSDRLAFSFTDPSCFEFVSGKVNKADFYRAEHSAETALLPIEEVDKYADMFPLSFKVLNGADVGSSNYRTYEFTITAKIGVAGGKEPFLTIPATSKNRVTLAGTDTDIFFSSNIPLRNDAARHSTTFKYALYRVDEVGASIPEGAQAIWTSQKGTGSSTVGHATIPGDQLTQPGVYAFVVTAPYYGGEAAGYTNAQTFSATAYLTVKQGPAKVTLAKLDSYAVMDNEIPAIGYTVSPTAATVMYTVQKSGDAVGEKVAVTDGTIPFSPTAPVGLKDVYVITVYARNNDDEAWSVDSLSLTVYNHDALDLIVKDVARGEIGGSTGGVGEAADGSTVTMNNAERVVEYLNENGFQLTFGDFTAMRTDISLQKIVSVNYGSGVWGALSDKMQWSSSDPNAVGINYEEGGFYADINVYSYTSYSPYSDFLIVGKEDAEMVTITATHAATGMQASFNVKVETLKNKLYLFQFYPKTVTTVHYINGKGEERLIATDEQGRLAVYEPDGIKGSVTGYANIDGEVYVGTFMNGELITGEADVATLQLYPCNNIRLRSVSSVQLTFVGTDNQPYNGEVILRGGVYKNNIYCPEATIRVDKNASAGFDGRKDIVATVTNGKLNLWFDATQFRNETYPEYFRAGDKLAYVFEYRFAETYQPGYVILRTVYEGNDVARATDSLIQLKLLRGAPDSPQITAQTLQQYHGENHTPNGYTRNVTDFNENIGISKEFDMARLYTDIALLGETLELDDNGNRIYDGANVLSFAIYQSNGRILEGQSESRSAADRIFDLTDLEASEFFIFPFSAVPFLRSSYLMTDETLSASGITNYKKTATGLKAVFKRGESIVRVETLPYGVANLTDLPDPKNDTSDIAQDIKSDLEKSLDLGEAFNGVNTDALVRNGLVFLGGMKTGGSKYSPHLVILPTANPEVFRIIAFIGYNKRGGDNGDGVSVNYDPDKLSEDFEKFKKELDEMDKKNKKSGEGSGEGSLDFNFYGAIQLQTQWNASENKWEISFTGGNVGGNIEGKYEWSYQTMCGPYPFLFTLELGFHVDAELAFANKDGARAMLLDAAFGVSIEAFAGLGFDLSLVSFQLGIFGSINADYNYLWLTDGNKTGSKLSIKGEIGIRMKVKLLFVSYSQTFCSLPFNIASQRYGDYTEIRRQWEELGYAELSGTTKSGRLYTMVVFPDGTAMATVDNGAQLESRDYLELNERFWYGGGLLRRSGNAVTTIQENAYPYANPVLTEDGDMFLYLSDNGVSATVQSSVSYAVKNGGGYDDKGRIDPDDTVCQDTGLAVSGYGDNVFAAWIRQIESPEKESRMNVTNDDLGMMLNAAEIYGSIYKDGKWTTVRLTENNNPDLSPVVASYGDRAIVAWRSLGASEMPKNNTTDLSTLFNVENTIRYRIYSGGAWSEAQIAYNGSAGTVNAVDVAMLADGTALIAYTVRTGEDETTTETFYTAVGTDGGLLTTGRLTNDDTADLNVQIAALDDGFVLGWYAEHIVSVVDGEPVKAHDIRFAYVNANGSVGADLFESAGGDADASFTSDFRFSAPAGNRDLNKLSLVWSHRIESNATEDDGKYAIEAMRFYKQDGAVGLTAPITVVETDKNFTVNHFDSYTDEDGKVYVVFLGSDYSNIDNISYFDSIDFANAQYYSQNTAIDILEQEPVCFIKLASAFFAENAIEADAQTNLRELVAGLELPVQFTVRNVGTCTVHEIALVGGGIETTFKGLNLLPGETTTVYVGYSVPESEIRDVTFTLTPDDGDPCESTLVLNRPDVGIAGMKIVREENSERDIRLTLTNISGIPLDGSGKTVKLAFYRDSARQSMIGQEITIDPELYADIDQGIGIYTHTLKTADILQKTVNGQTTSVNSASVYAYVWVEDSSELYPYDNYSSVTVKTLALKNGAPYTVDHALKANEDGSYTLYFDLCNNAAEQQTLFFLITLYDENGATVGRKLLSDGALTLDAEEKCSILLDFSAEELSGVPVTADYTKVQIVWLDYGQTSFAGEQFVYTLSEADGRKYLATDENGRLAQLPAATPSGNNHFNGWYTATSGNGTFVTSETVFTQDTTIYAYQTAHVHQYTYEIDGNTIKATCSASGHSNRFPAQITMNLPTLLHEASEGDPNATLIGRIDDVPTPTIVYKQGDTVLDFAPTTRGEYTANLTYGEVTLTLAYTITAPLAKLAEAPTANLWIADGTERDLITAGTAVNGEMRYALGTDENTVPTEWNAQIPTTAEAGVYYVWYKVEADADYYSLDPVCLLVSVHAPKEDPIGYVAREDEAGVLHKEIKEVPSGYIVQEDSARSITWNSAWYVVKQDVTINGNVTVNGNAKLLICDGATLTINGKITVNTNATLDLYAQAGEAGKLNVFGTQNRGAVIYGAFRVHGGEISIFGKEYLKYSDAQMEAFREDDPYFENVKLYETAVEIGRYGAGEDNLSANGAYHDNAVLLIYRGNVKLTGVRLNDNSELRSYSGTITVGALEQYGDEARLISFGGNVTVSSVTVSGTHSSIAVHSGTLTVNEGIRSEYVTRNNVDFIGVLELNLYGGVMTVNGGMELEYSTRAHVLNIYGGVLNVSSDSSYAITGGSRYVRINVLGGDLYAFGNGYALYSCDLNVLYGSAHLSSEGAYYAYAFYGNMAADNAKYYGDKSPSPERSEDNLRNRDSFTWPEYVTVIGAGNAEGVEYIGFDSPVDTVGMTKKVYDYVSINSKNMPTVWENAWYVVTEDVVYEQVIFVGGDVHVILCDGATLTAKKGIRIYADDWGYTQDTSLWLHMQKEHTGKLIAESTDEYAAIDMQNVGYVYIQGGTLDLEGNGNAAIRARTVIFYDGLVKAKNGEYTRGTVQVYYGGRTTILAFGNGVKLYYDSSEPDFGEPKDRSHTIDLAYREFAYFKGVSIHGHIFTYELVDGKTFVATCHEDGCDLPDHKISWTPTIESGEYNGNPFAVDTQAWIDAGAKAPRLIYCFSETEGEADYDGYVGGDWPTVPPVDAGYYYVEVSVDAKGLEWKKVVLTFTIKPYVIGIEWSHTDDLIYNGNVQAPTAVGVFGDEKIPLTVVGGQTNAGTYTATAVIENTNSNFALPESNAHEFTISPKKITATIEKKTSVYGENQAALTATTEEGAIVNGDEGVYALTCVVGATSHVGSYDITGTDLSDNYAITFVGEQAAYEVTKRPITATAVNETIKYGDMLPTFRFTLSESVSDSVLSELTGKLKYICDGDPTIPGKYPIVLAFTDDYTTENVLRNYTVELENAYLYILAKTLTDGGDSDVEILLEDADDAFAYGISVKVETVSVLQPQDNLDMDAINAAYVNRRSEISKIYSVKLYRTVTVDGVETVEEIQPSDLKEGLNVIVRIEIPDYLEGRKFRVLHIHSQDDIEYVSDSDMQIEDGYVSVRINRLSDFAFVHLKDNEEMNHLSFCLGWLLVILDAFVAALLVVYLAKKRRKPLGLIGLIASVAVPVYGIVAICLHLCVVTIVALAVAVLLCAAFLVLFLADRKNPRQPELTGKKESEAPASFAAEKRAITAAPASYPARRTADAAPVAPARRKKQAAPAPVKTAEKPARRERLKKAVINVGTISESFTSGETVTLQTLKEKKLIPISVEYVKLLANGNIDKALNVELQSYSPEAAEAIVAAGGSVKLV